MEADHPRAAGSAPTADRNDIAVQPNDLAAIVYTLRTTGRPKGVMLSHGNIMANVKAILKCLPVEQSDVFLSFLPLSHTFERTAGYYLPIAAGACVANARSTQHLSEDLKTVRPTVPISVPRIYERFYAKIFEYRASAAILSTTPGRPQPHRRRPLCSQIGIEPRLPGVIRISGKWIPAAWTAPPPWQLRDNRAQKFAAAGYREPSS